MGKRDLAYIKKFEECTRGKEVEQLEGFIHKLDDLKISLIKLKSMLEEITNVL